MPYQIKAMSLTHQARRSRPTTTAVVATNISPLTAIDKDDIPEEFGGLSPFVVVPRNDNHKEDHRSRYDPEIDIPRPRTHSEVVRHRVAKSAAGRRRAELESSEEATRPFSRLNRARTAQLLMARERRSRREVEKAQNASQDERGIDETLTQEMRGLNVLEQARHPRLQAVPLLSRSASSAGSKQGRSRREMARITETFGFVEDNDHRAAAVNVQGEALDDAWVALLGSTLEANKNIRSVLLNRNSIGDKGVALLARSLRINSSVEVLSLGGNHVTDEGARSFAGLLKSGLSSLKALNLAGATSQPASIMQSGSGVKDHLADACIRAPGAAALALALGDAATRRGCFLLSLNLAYQRVWDAGAIALAAALRRPACHLEALGLSGTQLTDAAADAFSRALMEGKTKGAGGCQPLNHEGKTATGAGGRDCFVVEEDEEEGAWAGGRVVAPCSLRRLDLSRNSITDTGARNLAMGLRQSAHRRRDHDRNLGGTANGNGNDQDNGTDATVQAPTRYSPLAPAPPAPSSLTRLLEEARTTEPSADRGSTAPRTTPATYTSTSSPPAGTQRGGLMGLDLAFNRVGPAGIAALHHALTTAATGMVFLELRGHKDADNSNESNDDSNNENSNKKIKNSTPTPNPGPTTGELLQEIEAACEQRRQVLQQRQQLDLRRRTSTAVASSRASLSSSPRPMQARNTTAQHKPTPNRDGVGSGRDRRPGAGTTENNGGDPDPDGRDGLRRLPGCENSMAKPRPLEGALPIRGYYVSPLLDSYFDLLMLREPVGDPGDLRLYLNRTRDMLEQRRALREQQQQRYGGTAGGNGRGKGRDSGTVCDVEKQAAAGRGVPRAGLKKGGIVSPLAINLERENILAERRRLFYEDSDFAARKNARITGRGRNKASRSKLLTQKHTNTAFTKELLTPAPGLAGVRCPRGLRAHYLGLQNFDWGSLK